LSTVNANDRSTSSKADSSISPSLKGNESNPGKKKKRNNNKKNRLKRQKTAAA
jgi:hypothetical protein